MWWSDPVVEPFDLERFVVAQQGIYNGVVRELRNGRKTGHWMWFIFPQVAGLGMSEMSRHYAIASLVEARAYLEHPVLGRRLRECAGIVAATTAGTAGEIFGEVDALKLRSSMTLFHRAAPDEPVFRDVIVRCFGGITDDSTDVRLARLAC